MIEQLNYAVRFPPTDHYPMGRSFDRSITFEKGMINIVGPNEVGKTFVLEMIEFLLFGSAALRGKADDYKHLKASGAITIRGQRYQIERTHRNASLNGACEPVVGTKPVNARLLQILGYGLDVFRVANVANQGDAERLSKMKPTERKAMVDRLIGADQIEALAKWCGEEALGVGREITGLEQGLVEPVEPVAPEGYGTVTAGTVAALRAASDRAVELRALIRAEPQVYVLGEAPTCIPLSTLEKAEEILGLRTYDFDVKLAAEQLAGAELWKERQAFVQRAFPQPTLTAEQIEDETQRRDLTADLVRLRKSPTLVCPCGKPFTSADVEIARIERVIAELPVIKGLFDLDVEARARRTWDKPEIQAIWDRLKDVPEVAEPKHHPAEAKGAVHVSEVKEAIKALAIPDMALAEVRGLLSALRRWEGERSTYASSLAQHDAWKAQARGWQAELDAIDVSGLPAAEQLLRVSQMHDVLVKAHTEARASYEARVARLTDLRQEQQSWRNGKQALNDLREDTKNYLVPALSTVASHMISQMTGGQRSRIVVDEDFEIQVDGQPLNTLSGSGKVCANLAIRLGLGRILTNGVFPVFMGDEMDASMDDDRAQYLHDALVTLQSKLSQIMIITHKAPTCSQVIKLEN